jgi:hypothetical protein
MAPQDPQPAPKPLPVIPEGVHRRSATRWAFGIAFIAYLVVWVGLVAEMLSRPSSFSEIGDARLVGVVFVSVTMAAGFVGSWVWIAALAVYRLGTRRPGAPAPSLSPLVIPPLLVLVALGLFWFSTALTIVG